MSVCLYIMCGSRQFWPNLQAPMGLMMGLIGYIHIEELGLIV
jgi:hypothetical protein